MTEVMRFSSHSQITAAVPHILGFTPAESMVFIGVADDHRLTNVLRVNLYPVPPP